MTQYKALVFDLDGTATATKFESLPSSAIIEAVQKAKEKVFVSVATGRQYAGALRIINTLNITNPSIFYGGSQIVKPLTNEVLWKQEIPVDTVKKILDIGKNYPYKFIFSGSYERFLPTERKATSSESIIYIMDVEKENIQAILSELNKIELIAANKTNSWKDGCQDIHITHRDATKKNAMHHLLEILGVNKQEVIVIGDSSNDLPLFENGGLKVAMGNGTPDIKAKADFITLDLQHDGLAYAIEKFILNS